MRSLAKPLRALIMAMAVFSWLLAQDMALAQDASADARNTAATIAQGLQGSLTSTVTSTASTTSVPGYNGQTSTDQSQYFSNPSALAGAGASAAQSSSAYAVVTEQRTTTIDPKTINLTTAQAIAADPTGYSGISTSGSQGSCQTVAATSGDSGTHYDSCQIGSTEQDSSFTCTVGWRDLVATTTTYACEQKVISGINGGQATNVGTLDSCTQLAALGTCSKTTSATVTGAEHYGTAGSGSIYQPPTIQFPSYAVDTTTNSYTCSQAVAVSAVTSAPLTDWTGLDASGAPVLGNVTVTANAQQTGSTATLVSSTVDDSACQAQVGTITCPSGTSLQNGQCIATVPATLVWSCPAGWALSGTVCTLQQVSTASVTGYNCPADYTLTGTNCVSTQPAGISGYTCPAGYTLSGTTCSETLTQPARTASYTCPDGFTLSGSTCYESLSQAANVSFSCPSGYALSGTTCTLTTQAAAIISYQCPSGWTLNGELCESQTDYQALDTYTCPSTWTLSGSACISASTYNATLIYTCPQGWSVSGSSCLRTTAYAPDVSYSCPGGWNLNGTVCTQQSSYPAIVTYSCNAGWSQDGATCSTQASQPASVVYGCPGGYSLNGTSCSQTNVYPITWTTVNPGIGWFYVAEPNPNNPSELLEANNIYSQSCGPGVKYQAVYCGLPVMANGCVDMSSMNIAFVAFVAGNSDQCLYRPGQQANCWSGGKWDGSQCTATSTIAATPGYVCQPGQSLSGSQCLYTVTQGGNANSSCSDGSAPVGTTCYLTSTQAATASFSCPQGGSYDGSQCQLSQSQDASPSYICPSGGALNGTTCVITNTQAATDNYSCPQGGALDGTTCHLTNLQPATVVYGCPEGATLSGTMCLTTNTASATPNYACPTNYQLQGTTCVLSESTNATPILACPDGYLLNGSTCTETLSIAATEHFACATGYTLDGTTCTSTLAGTVAGYACPTGFSISGTTCVVDATQPASSALTCPGGGILTGSDCVTSTAPQSSSGLTCQTPAQICSDSSPTTRMVNGVAVSHDCWGWTDNYQCAKLTPANSCASLQGQSNCTFDHETCLDDGCYTKSEVYLCKTGSTTSTAQAVTCTGDIYCIDGSCNQVTREASPDFQNALVAINAMGDADGQFDPNTLTIFGGDATGCHKPLFGLVNCCAGKVSGLLPVAVGAAALLTGGSALIGLATEFLTLFLCSSEELQLDVKDRMGVCHYVGEYCSEKLLFACTTLRHQYCCFQTKLARVIQEQGRAQINKSWGDPKSPDCGGFSIAEFSQLDLSKMDFTEVYADFTSAVSVPASLQNTVTIQQKIQSFYAQHAGN